jgi:predicted Zn-dependent protease
MSLFGRAGLADNYSQGIQVETFRTHSRLVLAIDDSVETQWNKTAKGFELFLKGIGLSDLGAPLGEEDRWAERFQNGNIHDPRLASMSIKEVAGGVKIEGVWKFPNGKAAPARPVMETFDFHRSAPAAQYVLDFWAKEGPTLAEEESLKRKQQKSEDLKKADEETRSRLQRRLASEQKRNEQQDVTRFCREPLAETTDIFLPILPLHEPVRFSRWFATTTPDSGYEYFKPDKVSETEKDAQYARLALTLYAQGKPALVLRTLDFMDSEFPDSPHRHEMRFLRANAMLKLNMQAEGEKKLKALLADEKDNPVSLFAAEYLASKQFERGQFLEANENFLWLSEHYSTHRLAWVFHLGMAESLYALKQTDRAAKEYQWVIENAPESHDKSEAALRQGDLYMERLQYEQGLASYFQGLNYFRDDAKSFPAIFVNRAEALYGLGQFDRAREAFDGFLKEFPGHPAGWRAAFRIGEIEGRKPGDEARSESRHWFYETINHYPLSPGATLARLRLVPCGDHAGFSSAAVDRYFDNEAANFTGSGQISMLKYHAFQALAHVRSLISLGREPEAVELATDEIHAPTVSPEFKTILGSALGEVFRKSILTLLATGKKYEALQLWEEKYPELPKPDLETDTDYLIKLSQTASDQGLGDLAAKISDAQRKAEAALAAAGTSAASEGGRDLEADMKGSEKNFTQAKSLYVAAGNQPDTKTEGKIRELLATVKAESRFSYERELMLGLMDERKKELPTALTHAVRAQLLAPRPADGARDYRLDAWLASLQARAGDSLAAFESYKNIENHVAMESAEHESEHGKAASAPPASEILGVPPVPSMAGLLLAEGEIQEKLGHWGEAAAIYSRAMTAKVGGDEVVYGYARALLKTGKKEDREKGYGVLKELADGKLQNAPAKAADASTDSSKNARKPAGSEPQASATRDDFWKKLAREALETEKSRQEALGNGNQGGLRND